MLPQLQWAKSREYPVLIMNPASVQNESKIDREKQDQPQEYLQEQAVKVWEKYVVKSGFRKLLVVAFQQGGASLDAIQNQFQDTFYNQVG